MSRHKKLTTMQERVQQDLEFPDEVDTPVDQEARLRFQRYKGLKNIKTMRWDPYLNLPPFYARLFEFKNPTQSRKLAITHATLNGLALSDKYVKIVVKGLLPALLAAHPKDVPLVPLP
jgi:pre-rRNA-processing protein TSR1